MPIAASPDLLRPPVRPIAQADCAVLSHVAVNEDYRLIVLSAPPRMLACRPGQFFHLLCPHSGDLHPFLRRPMSLYAADMAASTLSFLYKVAGRGTAAMASLRPGDSLDLVGPLGQGFTVDPAWRKPLLVGRGVGLATLAPLAGLLRTQGLAVTAICSARTSDLLMSIDFFRDLGVEVVCVTDAEGTSGVDSLSAWIEARVRAGHIVSFFTCGSARLLAMLQDLGRAFAIGGQVALEQRMACGIGMCQACVRPIRTEVGVRQLRVCREGPVFSLKEVV